ncbi:MAG: hypothetical protein ABI222_01735 [Opitutaceae bacterium]
MEPQIKESLISLMDAIRRSDGTVIAAEMSRLDDFLTTGQTAGTLHPQLEHFLQKRSYAKALLYLNESALLRQGFAGQAGNPPGGCDARAGKPAKG